MNRDNLNYELVFLAGIISECIVIIIFYIFCIFNYYG